MITALVLSMCSCASNSSAIITDNEGNTAEMTCDELIDIAEGNSAKFEKYYEGASIDVTGKIEKIEAEVPMLFSEEYKDDFIYFEDGWALRIDSGLYDWADVDVGTTIRVKTNIWGYGDAQIGTGFIILQGCAIDAQGNLYSNSDLQAKTAIEIIKQN